LAIFKHNGRLISGGRRGNYLWALLVLHRQAIKADAGRKRALGVLSGHAE